MVSVSSKKINGIWFALALDGQQRLIACSFSDRNRRGAVKAVMETISTHNIKTQDDGSIARAWFQKLHDIYMGKGNSELKSYDVSWVSDFRKKVYRTLLKIPRGRVTTYSAIAKKLVSRRHARAVGTAVARNPLPLLIPCHRVLPVSLKVCNYGMPGRKPSQGAYVKRGLLEREGVKVSRYKVSKRSLWYPK